MKPDGFLLACRTGRWRWPWAFFGTFLTITLVLAIGLVTEPLELRLAAIYGAKPGAALDLAPGRLDTFAGFVFYALAMALAPALVVAAVHGLDPQRPLGPQGRFDWSHVARATAAMLFVLALDAAVSAIRDPQALRWLSRPPSHYVWLLAALPVVLFQSFSEEYLFKGYLVRSWGAVLPFKWLILLVVGALFTAGHAFNDDVAQDIVFNLIFFFLGEIVSLLVFFRTESLAGVTGLHWANNIWAMLLISTEPGQSKAMSLAVFADPILSAGKSRLTDPFSWCEVAGMLTLLWVMLTWRYSPLCLPKVDRDQPEAPITSVPPTM